MGKDVISRNLDRGSRLNCNGSKRELLIRSLAIMSGFTNLNLTLLEESFTFNIILCLLILLWLLCQQQWLIKLCFTVTFFPHVWLLQKRCDVIPAIVRYLNVFSTIFCAIFTTSIKYYCRKFTAFEWAEAKETWAGRTRRNSWKRQERMEGMLRQ